MLTKEQILSKMRGFDCPKYLTESCWQPIYDQCVAAIDLSAENEQLKAKLDAVRDWCVWHRLTCEASDILAIIDKGGDDT